jgi:hypothetical protein
LPYSERGEAKVVNRETKDRNATMMRRNCWAKRNSLPRSFRFVL